MKEITIDSISSNVGWVDVKETQHHIGVIKQDWVAPLRLDWRWGFWRVAQNLHLQK
ncbi:MAG: hypothetical protein SWX82_29360 [Cyanobacteriota bacterium]|nr:hypothetical protein [Cyanobacteriota bacterium]